MKRLRKIILIAVVIYILWKLFLGLLPSSHEPVLDVDQLANRPWLERMPKGPRDKVHSMALMHQLRQRQIGVAAYGSLYRSVIDVVGWQIEGERLALVFLEKEVRVGFDTKLWKCAGEAPKPFDLCLELKSGKQGLRLYSRSDWRRGEKLSDAPDWLSDRLNAEMKPLEGDAPIDADCPSCKNVDGAEWLDFSPQPN